MHLQMNRVRLPDREAAVFCFCALFFLFSLCFLMLFFLLACFPLFLLLTLLIIHLDQILINLLNPEFYFGKGFQELLIRILAKLTQKKAITYQDMPLL